MYPMRDRKSKLASEKEKIKAVKMLPIQPSVTPVNYFSHTKQMANLSHVCI